MIVLDASAAVELLMGAEAGQRVAVAVRSPEISLHAPHLIDLEVAQTLRRYVQAGQIAPERGRLALEHLGLLNIERYEHAILLPRIWDLRGNLTANDAAYVALAEALGAPLLTFDERLVGSTGHSATIRNP
ncbi:MAG: type II toxin-antitoxin system VapC family toxin [Gemmatimonadetes bacterium]|uniref:Ribonuclease VapC n=1 Tax=Candidatus Kutchimonas denitrificans TaxID=3056748 RepID=A0AAE5CA90_9BACT|nr:type II toxin-antitoxin system VapC family toxin [Gemmatimonadota bacterium]NIR74327.1 type II toxin-antitoxin system VapC family toxin [Candidatus Kutchimonas denitrificans]NIS01383.1 type II toxin-antitoxin system VapC family toxin [Gemmatimonadota bacterium]NIT67123.1 type II toxin-antitoxin system VapC family toxin [Gemmatimonadota bacterium]NIU52779.1 PIN domain-containing protein [Gemmatimonadota bacterium]